MKLAEILFGRPLATEEEGHQRVGPLGGVPLLGLDGLASAAYGPEAALAMLLPLGVAGLTYALPVTGVIVAVLVVLYLSYRQTQAAYPSGGGSYTVAKKNLGVTAGLIAAAALLLDYVLVVAVGISAGVAALISVFPQLHPYILWMCLGLLALITLVNLRGTRESAATFAVPTYAFIALMGITLIWGIIKAVAAGGHPTATVELPAAPQASMSVSIWLLMRSFANGCTAMTGVEAVSNGMPIFAEPKVKNAHRTLTAIVVVLAALLLGIAYLAKTYGVMAMASSDPGYQSVLSQLIMAVAGRGWFYFVTMAFVLAVLALSAQTGYSDFPRLCRMLALDDFMPHAFAGRGRRLVFTSGILVLTTLTAALLIAFKGLTEGLIPLFAVGAFSAFTLSQAGMVAHWKKHREGNWKLSMFINALGAFATFVALGVILATKFAEGAWIVALLIPVFVLCFHGIRNHYRRVRIETRSNRPLDISAPRKPLVILPVQSWNSVSERGLRFALHFGGDVIAIHVQHDGEATLKLKEDWEKYVAEPLGESELLRPELVIVDSPYRHVLGPILDYIRETRRQLPDRDIAVIIPELVESRWWHHFLHNQRAAALKAALLFSGDNRMAVINIPWYAK